MAGQAHDWGQGIDQGRKDGRDAAETKKGNGWNQVDPARHGLHGIENDQGKMFHLFILCHQDAIGQANDEGKNDRHKDDRKGVDHQVPVAEQANHHDHGTVADG